MNVYTMIVAIIFMGIGGAILILQQVKSLRKPSTASDTEIKLIAHVDALEQRVRTLERIATDSKTTLKETIDTL